MTEPAEVAQPLEVQRSGVRWGRVALILFILLLLPASWLARRAASRMEFFHLRSVAIEGIRYLKPETVMQAINVDTLRSVWDDTDSLASRVERLPQVSSIEIERRLPGTLVLKITENLPVALAPSPRGLEAVDSSGVVLPIDPTQQAIDLPVAAQRDKAILTLLASIRGGNPMLFQRVSEIARDGKDAVVMQLSALDGMSGYSNLRVRAPVGVSVSRLSDIFPVESDLARRRANVAELDLRYRDQVIARLQ
jgi:cell division protein FtsQ